MPTINWEVIDFADFELLIFQLVRAIGFDEPIRVSGSGDRGEDIVAFEPIKIPGIQKQSQKWVFQCKRVKNIRKSDIKEELANFEGRKIDTWVLAITIDPSPGLRDWFYRLGKTQRYPFHIQAWWKTDLENHVITYADYLIKYLPDQLINNLKLNKITQHEDTSSLQAIIARLRLFADSQIERFARGKYIPKLYVQRRLQEEIGKITSSEATIAKIAKSSRTAFVEASLYQLKDYLKTYDNKTAELEKKIISINNQNKDLLKNINSLKKSKAKGSLKESNLNEARELQQFRRKETERLKLLKKDLERRKHNKEVSESFIKELISALEFSNFTAKKLPDDYYFTAIEKYRFVSDSINSTLSLINSKRKDSDSPQSEREPRISSGNAFKKEPEIEMLSDNGFIYDLSDRLRRELNNLDSLFKNTLVIIDRAGSGKTNIICHLVNSLSSEQPTILLFGKEHFPNPDGLIKAITDILSRALNTQSHDPVTILDRLLEKEGQFLTIFIDGINENRRIGDLDIAIASFLEWACNHRIKVIMTCRDIYWEFFSFESWEHHVQQVFREELNQFSTSEYGSALPLYLEYYHIDCNLADEARTACHHPLLLRFFCEAYGSAEGPSVNLGEVRDIRLKELFDIYLSRKTDQIRRLLAHRNSDLVSRYLFDLVSYMFRRLTTVIATTNIEEATGDANTSTQESLYLHLLDEDIIIEEQPGDDIHVRRVSFVYEEFMEYLLAKSILLQPKQFNVSTTTEIFTTLNSALNEWVNSRGVGEYIALMLIEANNTFSRAEAVKFLGMMAQGGDVWRDAFWSAIGKCPENYLGSDIFDQFFSAIDGLSNSRVIKRTLSAMSRYSQEGCNRLASVLLWSVALPKALTWTELNALPEMSQSELQKLSERLTSKLSSGKRSSPPGRAKFESLLNAILPFVTKEQRNEIEKSLKNYGGPTDRVSNRALLRVFWKSFPQYYPLLLNGLFSEDDEMRSFCADRLRFTKIGANQVSYLCLILAENERDKNVKKLLIDSANYLSRHRS